MPAHQIESDYELNTDHSIVCRFRSLDRSQFRACSSPATRHSGDKTPADAAHNAVILEAVAKLAFRTVTLASDATVLERVLPTSTSSASTAPRPDTARPDTFL
jgi:L-ribulose-5-phosphate 4-epimerase